MGHSNRLQEKKSRLDKQMLGWCKVWGRKGESREEAGGGILERVKVRTMGSGRLAVME